MPAADTFTFDTAPFMNGLKKVTNGIGGLQKSAGNMAKNVSRGIINAVAKVGLLVAAFKGVKAAINEMPEIGRTFQIAKGIIMKNLLFPLRKAIFPLLQKFLDWVRDNRAMFVRWGQTLVNIFHSVVSAVKEIIEFGRRLASAFSGFIDKTFGLQIKSFQDLINVLTFKIAVVIEFLKALIEPLMETFSKIADILGTTIAGAFETLMGFVGGFLTGIEGIEKPIANILNNVKQIVDKLFTANEHGNSLKSIFENLGEIFGSLVKWVAEMTDSLIEGFMPHLEPIINALQNIFDAVKGIVDLFFSGEESLGAWKDIFQFLGDFIGGALKIALDAVTLALDGIKWLIEGIINIGAGIGDFFASGEDERQKMIDSAKRDIEEMGIDAAREKYVGGIMGMGVMPAGIFDSIVNQLQKVDDAIITKDGKIIRTNPADTIIAAQNFMGGTPAGQTTIQVDFTGMQIVVNQATQEEAVKVGEMLVETFRAGVTRELERMGTR